MINNKVKHLDGTGQQDERCWVESVRDLVLSGLPRDGWAHLGRQELVGQEHPQAQLQNPLEAFAERLRWQPHDDARAKRTGRSLLYYATVANDIEAERRSTMAASSV